jgi:hypothetical protein
MLFWQRKTYDYGPNTSGETCQNKGYAQHFQQLCNDIEALFPEKQAGRTEQTGRTGPSESHRQRMRELLDELRRLVDQSDV